MAAESPVSPSHDLEDARNAFICSLKCPADFTIAVDVHEWAVHSAIFADKSEFFKTLMTGNFKESSDRRVLLQDISIVNTARLIIFMYSGTIATWLYAEHRHREGLPRISLFDLLPADYCEREDLSGFQKLPSLPEDLQTFLDMYVIADRYLIPTLALECCARMKLYTRMFDAWLTVRKFVDDSDIDCKLLEALLVGMAVEYAKHWTEELECKEYQATSGSFELQLVLALAKSREQ